MPSKIVHFCDLHFTLLLFFCRTLFFKVNVIYEFFVMHYFEMFLIIFHNIAYDMYLNVTLNLFSFIHNV